MQRDTDVSTEQVLRAVEQLPPAEFEALVARILTLRAQRAVPRPSSAETALLLQINESWPPAVQQRFDDLVRKRQTEAITAQERDELADLTEQSEQRDARRLRALTELAHLRRVTLTEVMGTLGITAPPYA